MRCWVLAWCALGCADPGTTSPELASSATPTPEASAAVPAGASATTEASATTPPATASADIAGSANQPVAAAPEPGDRIYAKARFVWIMPAPRPSKGWVGYLTLGQSVRLYGGDAEKAKLYGPGCDAWYRVEPDGYVCLGKETTLDPTDPEFVALRENAADVSSPYPFRYAESLGAARYNQAPKPTDIQKAEWDFDRHQKRIAEGKGVYASIDTTPAGVPLPPLLPFSPLVREPRSYVAPGSTIAYTKQFDFEGRVFLLTSDHALVPKDRVVLYPERSFEGVRLGGETRLPLAFFRKQDRPRYRPTETGFEATDEVFTRLSHIGLSGKSRLFAGKNYLETSVSDRWVLESDAQVVRQAERVPYRDDEEPQGRKSWLDISILGGTLVAYEGKTPVFATLTSSGRGGLPVPGRPLISTASTPVGTFRVDGKFRVASMVSSTDASVVHADVQYVQNFHGAHALHGAYWHDAWGELKSGGCVNLSPRDAKWVFDFTDPKMPTDWHGLRSAKEFGTPTRVVMRP